MLARAARYLLTAALVLGPAAAFAGDKMWDPEMHEHTKQALTRPANATPEPAAVVAFAVGALVVGGAIRRSRRQG